MSSEETAAYRLLQRGFSAETTVGSEQQHDAAVGSKDAGLSDENRRVLVHFLDPGATKSISGKSSFMKGKQRQSLMERFESIFQSSYGNRLPSVPYQDARSKTTKTIPYVNVKCRFLESQIDLLQTHEDQVSHGGADNATTNAWHTRPYCYVYFVTGCQTLEEYRTKVKPAIQVFLSQLSDLYQRQAMQLSTRSSAVSVNSAMSGADEDPLPAYLLVYCPSRNPGSPPILPPELDADGNPIPAGGQRGFSLANRFRMVGTATVTPPDASETSVASTNISLSGGDTTPNGQPSSSTPAVAPEFLFNPLSVLTKVEKEVAKRMAMDFPQGTVATLTTLGNDYHANFSNSNLKAALEELERNEWYAMLQALSKTVVQGFDTICNGLLFALRKISNQRTSPDRANIGHYFLMKESLAFTYEQMNLPAEALLQYKELRVFLPDLPKVLEFQFPPEMEHDVLQGIEGLQHKAATRELPPVTPVWDVPEMTITQFRKSFQGLHYDDYYLVAPATELYLWERETSLRFQLGHFVAVLKKTSEFIMALWEYHEKTTQHPGCRYRLEQVDEWSFRFCWDFKRAAQTYLVQQQQESASKAMSATARGNLELFGRHLCDLVDFMRLRLLSLADIKKDITQKEKYGPFVCAKYQDISKPWVPWKPSSERNNELANGAAADSAKSKSLDLPGRTFLIKAFESRSDFLSQYMDCLRVCITMCNFCGRNRTAARLTMELVDLHVEMGQIPQASEALQSVAKVYARDGWNACHFLLHFRMAGFRRNVAGPRNYLATLVHCFSRHNNSKQNSKNTKQQQYNPNTPPRALELLCQDFEAVMAVLSESSSTEDRDISYSNSPIFEAAFRNPDNKMKRVIHRKLPRKLFSVGDTVKIILTIRSHLPRQLDEVGITASLVPHKTYVTAQKQKKPLGTSDVKYTIPLSGTAVIRPGENRFELDWVPAAAGQLVLSQLTVTYKSTNFVYTHDRMKELGFWMDVLPVEPTQSMTVKPLFLVPGHEQRLQIEFRSGEDHVQSGELNLVCSPGLALLPSDEEEGGKWSTTFKVPLKECPPGESQTFEVFVTGAMTQSFDENETMSSVVPTVHAKISTMFRCGTTAADKALYDDGTNALFQHEMESVIPTLADNALTVGDVSLNPYSKGKAIVSVAAKCHVPAPYILQTWDLELPSYLKVLESSDAMNKSSKGTKLVKGETVCFAFDCSAQQVSEPNGGEHSALVTKLKDEHESSFEEQLFLRVKKRAALPAMNLPEAVYQMVARADLSSDHGSMGVPVQLTYTIDTNAFADWKGVVLYTLDTDNEAWLLAGNTKGAISLGKKDAVEKEWKLTFSAIPTRPGVIEKIPSIELKFEGDGLEIPFCMMLPFASDGKSSGLFQASLETKHSTIAFPTTSDTMFII